MPTKSNNIGGRGVARPGAGRKKRFHGERRKRQSAVGVGDVSADMIKRQAVKTACLCIGIDYYLNSTDLKSVAAL